MCGRRSSRCGNVDVTQAALSGGCLYVYAVSACG